MPCPGETIGKHLSIRLHPTMVKDGSTGMNFPAFLESTWASARGPLASHASMHQRSRRSGSRKYAARIQYKTVQVTPGEVLNLNFSDW